METQINAMAILEKERPQLEAVLALNASPDTDVKTMVLEELKHLEYAALAKPEIMKCDPRTVVSALRTVLKQNLSLDPYQGLVYIKTRNINTGTKSAPSIILALEIEPTANGLISINRQAGRILDVDRPEVKYDSMGKVISVSVKFLKPTFDASGNKATRWQEIVFDQSDILRWKKSSHRQNAAGAPDGEFEKANALYRSHNGGVDPEFARAKAIRHGLKKLGTNMNEKGFKASAAPSNKAPIVDAKVASEESKEEFATYSEVKEEGVPAQPTITLPNVDDL